MRKKNYLLLILAYITFLLPIAGQNNCLDFDGIDDNVDLGSPNVLNQLGYTSYTIEAWIKTTSDNETQIITGCYNGPLGGSAWALAIKNGKLRTFIKSTGYNSEFKVNDGVWHHVACVRDKGNDIIMYVDGVEIFSKGQESNGSFLTPNRKKIGKNPNGNHFDGQIDEVRYWKDVRTETEIRANMYKELLENEDNLVGYYKFNETSGNSLIDNGPFTNHGDLKNMTGNEWTTSSAFFGPKNCLDFDGVNEYAQCNNPINITGTSITVESWIYPTNFKTATHQNTIIGNDYWGGANSEGFVFRYGGANGDLDFTMSYGSGYNWHSTVASGVLSLNTWQHVAATYNGSLVKLYVNGKEVASDSKSTSINSASQNARIGDSPGDPGNRLLVGKVDEVRAWDIVRSVQEIREDMFRSLTGIETGLKAYYNFDNKNGTKLQDFSGNAYDADLQNMENSNWAASSAFNNWLNTSSNNPATTSNWSSGTDLVSTDNVGIYNYSGSDPIVSTDFDCNHFFLETGASFTLNDGASFIAQGNEFINGTFNIKQTLTSNAEVGEWHFISPPNDNTTAGDLFDDMFLQEWHENGDNEGFWTDIIDPSESLTPMTGYSLWVPKVSKMDFTYTGTPFTGEKSIGITSLGSGVSKWMNFVGNPYPSYIDWNLISGYGSKYTWNGTAYEAYNTIEGFDLGSSHVAPMEGFFIYKGEGVTDNFILNNNMRSHAPSKNQKKKELQNFIALQANNGNYDDDLWIVLNETASADFEIQNDAWKLKTYTSGISQLWSICGDGNLSIDVRPFQEIIPLGFANNQNGNYSININKIDGINSAELEDTKLNSFHDLSKGAYNFDWNTTDSEERFILHLKATATQELVEQEAKVYSSDGQVYIRQTSSQNFNYVQIFDLAGRVVYSSSLGQEELQSISLSNAKGTYLVQLIGENQNQTNKVIL